MSDLDKVVTAGDGGRFRVTRVGAGVPVVLIPGMFDNRRLYLWPGGGGLATALADAGFDAWVVERRGTGGVAVPPGVRAGWDEVVRFDLPAVQELVAAEAARPAFWVAHSFGGPALARAAADTLVRSQIAGLVLVNAAVEIPLLANPAIKAMVTARRWGAVFPARRFRLGPEDEPVAALRDAIAWGAAERESRALSAALATVDIPVLALTAPRDFIAPATRCRRLAEPFTDRRVQSAARRTGFACNHTHESALLDPVAATDVFPFIRDWIAVRSGQVVSGACAPAGRHRLHYAIDLDAPPDAVFDVLTRRWSELWPVRQHRVRDGVDPAEPDGLRSVRGQRALGVWPIQEEIITHRRPGLIEYRTIRGPVRNHLGRLELTPTATGTHLDYSMAFDTPRWVSGRLLAAALDMTWRRWSLTRLRHQLA